MHSPINGTRCFCRRYGIQSHWNWIIVQVCLPLRISSQDYCHNCYIPPVCLVFHVAEKIRHFLKIDEIRRTKMVEWSQATRKFLSPISQVMQQALIVQFWLQSNQHSDCNDSISKCQFHWLLFHPHTIPVPVLQH